MGVYEMGSIASPAKINLTLEILGRRPDGYHELATVFHQVELSDTLSFRWEDGETRLVCNHPGLSTGEENLILKAVRLVEGLLGSPLRLEIRLEKKIPVGAGLGGGSSNAAAILRALGRRYKISEDALFQMAVSLGSDVPFFLRGGTSLGRGRGEALEDLPRFPPLPAVIVKPPFSISTAEAYGKIDHYSTGEKTQTLANLLRAGGKPSALLAWLVNDFEEALFPVYPKLSNIKEALLRQGALAAQLSGSGSAVFGLARDPAHAEELAGAASRFGEVWTTST